MQMAKEPLIQFLIIGACIYGAYALFGAPDEDIADKTVIVDARRIDGFIGEWQRRWNRPPTRAELEGVINAFVRENILYRQAVAMGLDADDPITRRRMAQKLEFLTNDIALLKEPGEGELEQYFQANIQLYRAPDLITFSHAYLDPDRREAATLDDAAALLSQLQAAGNPDPRTLTAGDRFMLESYYPQVSELDIRRQFGSGFSQAVMQLEPGKWHGPVLSGYGVHLVYVYSLQQAPSPVFEDNQQSVLANWQTAQQEKFNADFFENLKNSYDVVIAELPLDRLIDGRANSKVEDKSDAVVEPAS
jgi:peptidyl-prolyl cis-trans isomerase C